MSATGEYLRVGEIRRAHGVRGECLVAVLTDRPESVFAESRVLVVGTAAGLPAPELGTLTVAGARPVKGGLLVAFREIEDRAIADSFRGRTLLIRREEAEPLEADEYFVGDLIGLEVRTAAGGSVGTVTEVYEGGAGYLLGISGPAGEQVLPMRREVVKRVDLARRVVTIEPPAGWPY